MKQIVETLGLFKSEIDEAIVSLQERVSTLENTCEEIKAQQEQVNNVCKALELKTSTSHHDFELRRTNCGNLPLEDSKKVVFDAPDRNKWFTGREKEIDMLEKCFNLEHNDEQLRMAAICGLGGCGKTTLAAHFAWKHKPEYEGGVFWFSMEDDNTFDSCIRDTALRLGLTADTLDLILSKVLTFISQQQKPWLMVLDNVDQAQFSDKMRKVLFGRWKRQAIGHLLITTRRERKDVCQSMGLDPPCCVEVFSFSNDEAKEFLVTRCGVGDDKGHEETLNELVCELGCLPLALEQAGARIRSLQCPMSKYLQEYKTERLQLLIEHQTNPSCEYESQSRLSVHTTWLLNFEHMKNSKYGDKATRFVQVAAFLDPDEIHEDLINSLLSSDVPDEKKEESPLIINHIVEVLTKFSLFQRKSSGCLMLHRVVQDVIRSRMTSEEIRSTLRGAVGMLSVAARSISDSESAGEVSVLPIVRHWLSLERFIRSCPLNFAIKFDVFVFHRFVGENSLLSQITRILKQSKYGIESYRRLSALLDVDYDDWLGVARADTKFIRTPPSDPQRYTTITFT